MAHRDTYLLRSSNKRSVVKKLQRRSSVTCVLVKDPDKSVASRGQQVSAARIIGSKEHSYMNLTCEYIEDKLLRVRFGDLVLFDYTYRPDIDPFHFSRPFMHPIRTLAGDVLTNAHPSDHPWHNGLSMTLNNVNGMNFWGGGTYRRASGQYEDLPNVGKQIHREWMPEGQCEDSHSWTQVLDWIGPNGEQVLKEKRTLSACDIDPELGMWRLIWESSLKNVLGEKLAINACSFAGKQPTMPT